MKTIRQLVSEYQNIIGSKNDLPPQKAAKILVEISALLGNINDQILLTDIAYNHKLKECYDNEEKANRAKILAETSDEYVNAREAKNTEKLTLEMIRSLKYYLRSKESEYKESNN